MLEFFELLKLSLIAGFIGSFFMTISQEVDLRVINKRPVSFSPALAFFKIIRLDFEKLAPQSKVFASYAIHFVYGTVWGFPLALFYFFWDLDAVLVGAIYFLIVLSQGWIVLGVLGIAGPPWTWGYRVVLSDIAHKVVYTIFVSISFMLLLS